MPRKSLPSLRRHRPSSQGVVTLNYKDVYLGPWPAALADPPEAVRARYDAVVAEWLASGRGRAPAPPGENAPPPADLSVAELVLAFLRHAETHYRDAKGRATTELAEMKDVLGLLVRSFGTLKASDFGPLKLRALRDVLVGRGLARTLINQRVGRVVRCFKWGTSREMVPADCYVALRAVEGLKRNRTAAPERPPVGKVEPADFDRALAASPPVLACLLRFMRHTGCRPGEAALLRQQDLDRSGPVWWYVPESHKTAWRGKGRRVAVGPKARQAVLDALALHDGTPEEYVFSPRLAVRLCNARKRAGRKTKVQPSQQSRKRRRPKKSAGPHYTSRSLAQALARACRAAGVPRFGLNRIRHLFATEARQAAGIEAARTLLGHSKADTTEIYAQRDADLAAATALRIG